MAEVFPKDVLLRVGGRALDQGVLAIAGAGRSVVELKEAFTRSSVGYTLDRDGIIRKASADKVRDYWPVGLVDSKGRRLHGPLIEGARGNGWATVTENYADGAWAKVGTTVSANATTAPDGVGLADKIVESALNETHRVGRTFAGATDNTRSSAWFLVKAAERTWCAVRTTSKAGTIANTWFNLSTGALGTKAASHDAWIRPLGSLYGFYFVAVSFDVASGGGTPDFSISLATGDNVQGYAGDGASGLYVWESGVEVDKAFPSHPGSILPNGLARTADIPSLLANFGPMDLTSLMRMERPLHADVTGVLGQNCFAYQLGDTNGNIRQGFLSSSRIIECAIDTAGTDRFPSVAVPAGAEIKVAVEYRDFTLDPSAPQNRIDATGAGYGALSGVAGPLTAFTSQSLQVGNSGSSQLCGVLFDLMFLRGRFTHAEAMAASDA